MIGHISMRLTWQVITTCNHLVVGRCSNHYLSGVDANVLRLGFDLRWPVIRILLVAFLSQLLQYTVLASTL